MRARLLPDGVELRLEVIERWTSVWAFKEAPGLGGRGYLPGGTQLGGGSLSALLLSPRGVCLAETGIPLQ